MLSSKITRWLGSLYLALKLVLIRRQLLNVTIFAPNWNCLWHWKGYWKCLLGTRKCLTIVVEKKRPRRVVELIFDDMFSFGELISTYIAYRDVHIPFTFLLLIRIMVGRIVVSRHFSVQKGIRHSKSTRSLTSQTIIFIYMRNLVRQKPKEK